MPEMPEVEALAEFLAGRAVGLVVERALAANVSVLKTYDPPLSALEGHSVVSVTRHGKFLDVAFTGDVHLVTHLARAGWLRWSDALPATPPKPGGRGVIALRVRFTDGSGFDLTEAGTRKSLAVYVVTDPADVPGVARLGPDPLGDAFTRDAFAALLDGNRHRIKGVLRDQAVVAGIGNAYSDEILHAARMSPYRMASELGPDEVTHLYDALRVTLRDAVERSRGLAAGDLKDAKRGGMQVHGRTGEACPVCGDTIREVSFADSSLQYCPTCQTGGKPLADRRMSRLLK